VHGVIGNSWYRRTEGRDFPAEYDPDGVVFTVGASQGGELAPDDRASAKALRVDGIADALRVATAGRGHSVAIGLKPRAAAFVAGRRPDLAIWYEAAGGGMTTTSAYAIEPPAWLVELARAKPASRFFDHEWQARDASLLARVTGIADDAPGEGSVHGLDTTFPHGLASSDAPARAFLHTPYGDEVIFDTAIAALDALQLGGDGTPDLLALSFNAHDYAGHLWGPDAWETLELTLRLDERLGSFFELLDRRLGRDGWAIVLTSDHGATPVVERKRAAGARRIRSSEIAEAAEAAMTEHLGAGPWIASVVASNVYMTATFGMQAVPIRGRALDAAALAIAKLPGIAFAGRVDQVGGACEARRGLEQAICLAVAREVSGELYVVPTEGSLISDYRSGTHHDAPFADNRHVPILVMAPGLAPQAGTGTLLQVAPTVAALLRVPPPPAATASPLFGLRAR